MDRIKKSAFQIELEYLAARVLVASLEWTPRAVAESLARGYARALDLALPRLRRVAMRNLQMVYPAKNARERKQIVDGSFRSIARLLVAFARFPAIGKAAVNGWIAYEGYEHFEEALRRGKGVLFATAHLGNWELSAYAHALLSAPMLVVVRPLDNPKIDALVEKRRALSGNTILSKRGFSRPILRALKDNQAAGILVDQNATLDSGVFVDFLGVSACVATAFVKLAAHSGAAVVPGFAVWNETAKRYVLKFYPIVKMTGDEIKDTRAVQQTLERAIAEYPDQWLWMHRRWKTRPPGEPDLYS